MADNTNYIGYNPGRDPLVNFNFMLRVELAIDVPCKSVRAFQRELEFDQIQEGGLNDYVHLRRKPITKPFTLEIERYVGTDYFDPLPLGAELVLPVLLFVSRSPAQFIPGVTARTYVFHGCTVMKKNYGDLVADQPGILVETTTIAYREMLCVDVPWSKAGDNILAPNPTQAHSAKTLSTEPKDLQAEGQRLYDTAVSITTKADSQYTDTAVATLIAELRLLKTELETGVASGGLLETAETKARKVLNGMNKTPIMPLFDIVNDRKMDVQEKKKLLREAENALFALQTAQQAEERALKRQIERETQRLLDYREQKSRAEEEIKSLRSLLNNQEQTAEKAKKAKDSAQTTYHESMAALQEAQNAYADEKEPLQEALQLAEAKREAVESVLERAKDRKVKCDAELGGAKSAAEQASGQLTAAQNALDKAEKALEEAQSAMDTEQDGAVDTQDVLAKAQETLTKAQEDVDAASEALEQAKTAEESAEETAAEAAEEVSVCEQDLADAQEAESQARAALESPDEGSELAQRKTAVENAQTARDKAKTALEQAEEDAALMLKIKSLENSIDGFDKRIKEALENGAVDPQEKKESANTDPAEDSTAEKPKTPLEKAREKADAARVELSAAQVALNTAQSEATAAQAALAVAEGNTKKAREGINSLENMINNLELRSDSVKSVREKYTESLASCKGANDTLQKYDAEDTGDHNKIRTTYQEVKKYHDDTQIQTKKVGEAEGYRENGVELKNKIEVWWTPLQPKTTN